MSRYPEYNNPFQSFPQNTPRFPKMNEMSNGSFFSSTTFHQDPFEIGQPKSNEGSRQRLQQRQQGYNRVTNPFKLFNEPFFDTLPTFSSFPSISPFPSMFLSLQPFQHQPALLSDISPPIEVNDNPKTYELTLSIPGATRNNITIDFDKNTNELIIKGEISNETTNNNLAYSQKSYSSFQRSLILPEYVDGENIDASLQSGVLHLIAPKIPTRNYKNSVHRISIKDYQSHPTATIEDITDTP